MTSATERLRALLDERGVAYNTHGERDLTWYDLPSGGRVCVKESVAGFLHVKSSPLTPKQAVEATLGPGTCHIDLIGYNQLEDRFQCNSCDWSMWFRRGTWPRFNYCPKCGKRVIG